MTIMIRSRFGGWREVTEEQARVWVRGMWRNGFTAHGCTPEFKREYLRERVEGIDVDKLLEGLK